jgi:hypothetical protein
MKNRKLSRYLGGRHELPYIKREKIEDDDIEKENDNAAATEEIEEERVAEEVDIQHNAALSYSGEILSLSSAIATLNCWRNKETRLPRS